MREISLGILIGFIILAIMITGQRIERNKSDYQIILLPDNNIKLISKDTIRIMDFYELEESILQDNL
jgi:hypothetical protein